MYSRLIMINSSEPLRSLVLCPVDSFYCIESRLLKVIEIDALNKASYEAVGYLKVLLERRYDTHIVCGSITRRGFTRLPTLPGIWGCSV